MSLKVFAVALPLLALQAPCMAQDLEKKGLPCVAELCLGDGLAELSKIQWAPAQNSFKVNNKFQLTATRKLSDDDLRALRGTWPSAGDAAPYLHDKQFDTGALPLLPKIMAACESNELFGTFGADSDTPTRVGISLTPSLSDPAKQEWIVTTIVREFPSAVSNDDKSMMTKLLNKRYAKFGAGRVDVPPAQVGEGRYFPGGMNRFGFGLSLYRGNDESARLKSNAACSAMDKPKAG
ncbi:hypothetical protein [Massilia sp. CF038]|uniref:hypothetical protein n=1 Tax=Massilia sp. CF038 TaxID=1881045 RepID=UPI0009197A44|nr:hypothetical protein [Massilia sp. CF038]SHG55420.1 hypothetical protein SAMN05428948_1002 [Massilia sp. CF038]